MTATTTNWHLSTLLLPLALLRRKAKSASQPTTKKQTLVPPSPVVKPAQAEPELASHANHHLTIPDIVLDNGMYTQLLSSSSTVDSPPTTHPGVNGSKFVEGTLVLEREVTYVQPHTPTIAQVVLDPVLYDRLVEASQSESDS